MQQLTKNKFESIIISILTLTIIIFSKNEIKCQIQHSDLEPIFEYLKNKEYQKAYGYTNYLIDKFPNEVGAPMGLVRSSNIFSGSVLVGDSLLEMNVFKERTTEFVGTKILTAASPSIVDTVNFGFMYNIFKVENDKVTVSNYSANDNHSIYYTLVIAELAEYTNVGKFKNQHTRLYGTLDKVEFNEDKNEKWIIKIFISDAEVVIHR